MKEEKSSLESNKKTEDDFCDKLARILLKQIESEQSDSSKSEKTE